jgi:hypothetical protein
MALGLIRQAERAITLALAMAPNNRYLLRNAVCLFISVNQPDRAHALVSRAAATPRDPWLLAAELTAARVSGRTSKLAKRALSLAYSADISPLQVSELASELGTMEMAHASKNAKRLFARALEEPNDNSLAQAEWASQRLSGINVTPEHLARKAAAEARSLHELKEGRWTAAFSNARIWLDDQFFSPKAAIMASYTSAVGLLDWEASYGTARLGLLVHPDEITLLNNAAYALIEMGRHPEAQELLSRIPESRLQEPAGVACLATKGLLAFREGNPTRGRELYRQAISLAHRSEPNAEALARLMLAREEMRIRSDSWESTLAEAIQLGSALNDAGVAAWIERLLAPTKMSADDH